MPKPLTLVLRRLNRVRKIVHKGDVHYCERTEDGTIIDNDVASLRHINPITLERWLLVIKAWEVVERFARWDTALPRGKAAKKNDFYRGVTLRLRDRKTGDVVLCDILI